MISPADISAGAVVGWATTAQLDGGRLRQFECEVYVYSTATLVSVEILRGDNGKSVEVDLTKEEAENLYRVLGERLRRPSERPSLTLVPA